MDTFELLDDIENELGIATCPINWPIGSGKEFRGVYDLSLIHIWDRLLWKMGR